MDQWPPPTTVFRSGPPTLGVPIFEVGPRVPTEAGAPHPLDHRFQDLEMQIQILQARVAQLETAWPQRLAATLTRWARAIHLFFRS